MNGPGAGVVRAATEADFAEIAAALGVSKQAVQKRANKEKWPFVEVPMPTGNNKRLFPLVSLPKAVRAAIEAARLDAVHALAVPQPLPVAVLPAPTIVTTAAAPSLLGTAPLAGPAAVITRGGLTRKARDDAHLNDKQRRQRDGSLVLCRAIDEATGASGCSEVVNFSIFAAPIGAAG